MANSDTESKITADHDVIRKWIEERGGIPSVVIGTGDEKTPGILRIDFPDTGPKPNLRKITWEEFFTAFDDKNLALLYQDRTATGDLSRFNKFVSRTCLG